MLDQAWTHSVEDVLKKLQVDPRKGLSSQEVQQRQQQYGPNGEFSELSSAKASKKAA
jgi:magnesium-transporting ATPase (P-type)